MKNQLKILREKLDAYGELTIKRELLEEILSNFAPSYKISDLSRNKLITPIKRGQVYINNFSRKEQDPYLIANTYFEGKNYMIGGLGVYTHYNFSTQVVEWHTVYNTKVSGKRIIGKNKFIFKKEMPSFFYGSSTIQQGNFSYKIMSPERAFIQMIKETSLSPTLSKKVDTKRLLKMSEKHASRVVHKKILEICL